MTDIPEIDSSHSQELLKVQLETADNITERAWNILRYTGTTFGILIAIVSINKDSLNIAIFFAGLILTIIAYAIQILLMWQVVKSRNYTIPPGTPNQHFTYEQFLAAYVTAPVHEYRSQVISDYLTNDASFTARIQRCS
jgi:hypothetical protein